MRILILFFTCTLLFSCLQEKKIKKPTWLFGKWKRIYNEAGKRTYEFWENDFSGIGFSLQKNDTVFKEVLHIITKNDSLFLQVTGVNETSTLFAFTQQTDTSFTAENKLNEFPKTIQYWKENNLLKANVSNDEFSIDFVFEKMK
ncbi:MULTISPECIES: hypothetical protein [Tenacibaculum]|uniref:Lipocalin-like domain-containing protein n=1 Tax=Tenacibaculum mesophilum TaxID=104268 RepID=A0ABM7CIX7_9FLAO|nr:MULTISPECIES: hypothetical protein [Tenacibaculum]GFD80375.1 hypothetical protein KUL118_32370 [Tenacibaculum sp. KUL118]GFD92183.1 hypothetical protein KUL154_09160 [Alteromonas sp. KUL154]GFE01403.1 hypothetical protein KUL156_39950 [Alteromonas sp. KUL156]AZJ33764.1 hypothetical protein D6200_14780 [Tenacibaculum mesophilum]MCG7501745.1 hypothetical protein [Tenacibaculum sp. Mcav3-52]